jgi:DNA uptake protein ComE-like DNA-binding protein
MRHRPAQLAAHTERSGTVLIVVLVVVAMLTLGAYTFSEIMVSESEATAAFGRQAESRAFADSGVEHIAAILGYPEADDDLNLYQNFSRFQAIVMRDSENARGRGYFSVVAPVETDFTGSSIRFGLVDESGKLNLNQLLAFELSDEITREMLMFLPNMTEDIADAILDWIDDDTTPRDYGVEYDYYESLDPPYTTKDGPLESLDELLQVAGVTPDLLYGEDLNRNGLLDPNENDGEATEPFDNGDGVLDLGWRAYLTIDSKESNLRADGEDRIFVNNVTLDEMFDTIEEAFDEDVARFVVAFRMNGPVEPLNPEPEATSTEDTQTAGTTGNTTAATGNSNQTSGSTSQQSGNTSGGSTSNSSNSQNGLQQAASAVGNALAGAPEGNVTRGGMNLAAGAKVTINSLYELVGAQVEIEIDGVMTTLDSPWPIDSMEQLLPELFDSFTTVEGSVIPGRINVNQARYETLAGLPEMTEEIATAIINSPMISPDGSVSPDATTSRSTTSWLVTQGIVELATMAKLDKYLTARGHVFRGQVVGYFEEGGGYTRLEVVIDSTEVPAKIISLSDLTELGRGYTSSQLTGIVEDE